MASTTYVSLLRGVNVSGQRPVDMKALVRLYQALGHSDVTTYIQSGNVVFSHRGSRAPASLARELEEGIARELGVSATVILRSAAELADIVRDNPFLARNADMRTGSSLYRVDRREGKSARDEVDDGDHLGLAPVPPCSCLGGLDERVGALEKAIGDP